MALSGAIQREDFGSMKYDMEPAISSVRIPMEEWARHGFVVGLCNLAGLRFGALRSSAFYRSFLAQLGAFEPDREEMASRLDYGSEVQNALTDIESEMLKRRVARVAAGRAARGSADVLTILGIVALSTSGFSGIGLIILSVYLFVTLAVPRMAANKDDDLTAAAFPGSSEILCRMPWTEVSEHGEN